MNAVRMTIEQRATTLAYRWADTHQIPPESLWVSALIRHIVSEVQRLGGDAGAYACVHALICCQLGLPV